MRITGGLARGIILETIPDKSIRPATDFLRESIFSSLGPLIHDATFLDLFAGIGAYGLEALSRGAKSGLFIEKNPRAVSLIEKSYQKVIKSIQASPPPACSFLATDVFKTSAPKSQGYDLIFIDPPYPLLDNNAGNQLLELAVNWLVPGPNSRIVLEAPGELTTPVHPLLREIRRLGKKSRGPSALIYGLKLQEEEL